MTLPKYPAWYIDWAEYHLRMFAMVSLDNTATLTAWWPLIEPLRTNEQELTRVTDLMLAQADLLPKLSAHFPALKRIVLAERQVEQTRRENEERDRGKVPAPDYFSKRLSEWTRGIGRDVN